MKIPKYYPANLFINYKLIIGYASATLVEAANNSIMAISLVEYLSSKQYDIEKKQLVSYLQANLQDKKVIFYPLSLKELIQIISKYEKT